jgi:hypothetical protein
MRVKATLGGGRCKFNKLSNRHVPSFATEVGRRIDDEPELIELAPGETSLSFLQRVYRSVKQPMSRRMRAAIEAMPHEHPRLGAVAYMNGADFAAMLDRAIERSGKALKQIEGSAVEIVFSKSHDDAQ